MSDDSPGDLSRDAPDSGDPLSQLRELLLGPDRARLREVQERLDESRFSETEVGRVLPDAIVRRSREDRQLTTALIPTVEEIVQVSVKRDPRPLVDALFPVIGPAIRKAVAETFRSMVQSLNYALERSLSWQGVKWRVEALRTGRPFAEVVLLHTLVYRVEQVFLIHRQSGLLLQHVVEASTAIESPDLVSGMLTAIQDFVRDSFKVDEQEALEAIQVGELTVWIEQGPRAVLAAVIRGTAPEGLKSVLQEALESIHLEAGEALKSFDGDAEPLAGTRYHLETCLQSGYEDRKGGVSPLLWFLLLILLIAVGTCVALSLRDRLRWNSYLERLQAEPGIVVTEADRRGGKYVVNGLRDPLAPDPLELLRGREIARDRVVFHWAPYQALDPEFILARAKAVLQPPATVSMTVDQGLLVVAGEAPHRWITKVRELAAAVGGIERYDESGLVDMDLKDLRVAGKRLDAQVLRFSAGGGELLPGQEDAIPGLVEQISGLHELAVNLGLNLRITVVGHTDRTGTKEQNEQISRQRADYVRSVLVSKGIPSRVLTTTWVRDAEPLRSGDSGQDRAMNRRVSFRVLLDTDSRGEVGSP